jgi:hypothetical protein
MLMEDITDVLAKPIHCDNCCSLNIQFVNNKCVYGQEFGDWPYIYFCNDCRASVGCHPGTDIPLGRMADRATRALRSKAHLAFDKLWNGGLMTRTKAYAWLAAQLEIEHSQCHISWLSMDQLRKVAVLSTAFLEQNLKALMRRKAKANEKEHKRREREFESKRRESDGKLNRKKSRHHHRA